MQTLTAEQFKQRYGTIPSTNQPTPSYGDQVAFTFNTGINYASEGVSEASPATAGAGDLVTGVGKILGGATQAAFSPVAPLFKSVGDAINFIGEKYPDLTPLGRKRFEQFARSDNGAVAMRIAEAVANYSAAAGAVGGVGVKPSLPKLPTPKVPQTAAYLSSTVRDIVPTKQRYINHQVSKALDLTPGDLNNIYRSTGNDVGNWMSEHNLIKQNKDATQAAVRDFKTTNYDQVRSEIGKVKTVYRGVEVPRYADALKQIQKQVKEIPGLEKVSAEVDNLYTKAKTGEITLNDVQRVKELLDEHFSLYKVTGDVAEGVQKEGLANMRKELQVFLEEQVQKNTGADIRAMNNNVQTARSVDDAITTRSPRGLTRSNIRMGDFPVFGLAWGLGGPIVGAAALFIKKAYETPTIRLRIARFIDQLSDAQKAKMQAEMEKGIVPAEFQQVTQTSTSPNKTQK